MKKYRVVVCIMVAGGLFYIALRDALPMTQDKLKDKHFRDSSDNIESCNASALLTNQEHIDLLNCMFNFKKFEEENVDRKLMEYTLVNSHAYLHGNSRVLDVGGYKGEDAAILMRKYDPYYMLMEPIPSFQKVLAERFKNNPKLSLLKFGLGKEDKTLTVDITKDAASLFRRSVPSVPSEKENATIRKITTFFSEIDFKNKPLDLVTINCKGCEYELLELLISNNIVPYLKNIQFKFHVNLTGIAHMKFRYCQITTLLLRTHKPTFQFTYWWQSWELRTEINKK